MASPDQVSRFCPECGQRARAQESLFVDPQICPKCKSRVMFLEHPSEMPPVEDDGVIVEPEKLLRLEFKIAVGAAALVLVGMALLAVGVFAGVAGIVLLGSLLMFAAGILGMAIFLDHRSKLKKLSIAYANCATALRAAAAKNRDIVARYHSFQQNYESIVESARLEEISKQQHALQVAQEYQASSEAIYLEAEDYRATVGKSVQAVANKYMEESKRNIKSRLTINNFAASRERLVKAAEFLEKQGCSVDRESLNRFIAELKSDFEELVRVQAKREEQALIKERIRDEERARIEIDRELKRIASERLAIEAAISDVLARTKDEHSAEIEMLKARLAEAEERSQRALSMAQQTKSGNVYVISNIGSFGERVFKVGMTRRLEPLDRVKELGDASVPFPFDVHMMIFSEDAPGLESAIHRKLNHCRVNRINVRKEFFRVDLEEIVKVVEAHKGKVEYVAEPEALEYRESLLMTDADVDAVFSNAVVETLDDDDN